MILVAGEALVDVVVDSDGDSSETPGGSPLNVAVGLARLEVPATLISQVGHDERGGVVVQHVTGSGAEIVAVPTSSGRTSVATAHLNQSGAASYDFDLEWSLPRQELPPCHALHVGSLGTLLEPGRDSVLDLVEQACARDTFVSFDANLRETFVDDRDVARRQVVDLAARCTLVKLSDEDADLLDPGSDPDDFARALLRGERTRLVLLTRGSDGATAFTPEGEFGARPRQTEVVDTVGAGDAFMAATLAQLWDLDAFRRPGPGLPAEGADVERLLRGAIEVAAITCERRGANPPRRQELPPGWPA
ncbi:MAG: carbohydrate kinase [Marmoricola sp.]|nr:carbohydrate kinase [Marmoricola sp.]